MGEWTQNYAFLIDPDFALTLRNDPTGLSGTRKQMSVFILPHAHQRRVIIFYCCFFPKVSFHFPQKLSSGWEKPGLVPGSQGVLTE